MEVHQALQVAMEKLQQRFTSLMQEKADLKERVEELEHRCIQLSGETDTIGVCFLLHPSSLFYHQVCCFLFYFILYCYFHIFLSYILTTVCQHCLLCIFLTL